MSTFLSINARAPLIRQSEDSYNERLETLGEAYSITEQRGFNAAAFTLIGQLDYLLSWFQNGLMRDIIWKGPDSAVCWRGYVDKVSLTVGGTTISRSVDKMANKLTVVYAAVTTGSNPNQVGAQTTTTQNDLFSQAEYGIKELYISGGEITSTEATTLALSELARLSRPLIGEDEAIGQSSDPQLKIDMKGYSYLFDWYNYELAGSGTVTSSALLTNVVAADPNGILTDTSRIETNSQARKQDFKLSPAWKTIDDTAKVGRNNSGVGEPWVAMVLEQPRLIFKAAEGVDSNGLPLSTNQNPRLYRKLDDRSNRILDEGGREVDYWRVRPDHILYRLGLPGPPMYITQVNFTPPASLKLKGRDAVDPLPILLRSYFI